MSVIINGKVYRNLQEQVLENTLDIEELKQQYGFKGPYETTASIPSDALLDNAIYLIGTEAPYDLYKFNEISGRFIPLGEFPQPGPQGPQGAPGEDGADGANGITPHIDSTTGNWFIGNVDTGVHAQGPQGEQGENGTDGTDGITPHIGANGNWFIGETDTNVHAQGPAGEDGTDGTNGTDGVTPHIDSTTGNWFIGDQDTGVHAQGPQGVGAYTAGTGINIANDTVSIKPDNLFTKSGINEITAGAVWTKTHNFDHYDGTENLAGLTIMDATTYNQQMLKPNHSTVTFFSAELFMQQSVNKGEESPEYTMSFYDSNGNASVYTFPRTKSGNVAVTSEIPTVSGTNDGTNWTSITLGSDTYAIPSGGSSYTAGSGIDITGGVISVDNTVALKSEIPDTTNMVTTDTDQSIYAGKYFRNSNASGYGRMTYSLLSYTDSNDTSTFSATSASFRNSNNTTGYSTGYGKEQINHRYKTGTSSLYKPFEISFTNETTSEVEGKYTFDPTKTGTVAVTSEIITSYNDLTDKPTIPAAQVNADWNAVSGVAQILNKPSLATVATSGSYNDLSNKPTIPDAVSGTNDGTNWTTLTIGSNTYAIPSGSSQAYKIVDVSSITDGTQLTQAMYDEIVDALPYVILKKRVNYDGLGSYSDRYLMYIETHNAGTENESYHFEWSNSTYIHYSASSDTYYTNFTQFTIYNEDSQTSPRYAYTKNWRENIPTATSDLTNDSGFITGITSAMVTSALGYTPGTSNFSGDYTDLTNKPSIPSTASSTSTVTPTTVQLTFTYSDNTTETVTLMTGATVATTTTLS